MEVLVGGFLGFLVGVGVCVAVRHFVTPSRAQSTGEGPVHSTPAVRQTGGTIPLPVALTLAGFGLWGGYVGWQAPGLEQALAALLVTGLLVTISLVDFQVRRIPNALVLALLLLAVLQALWLGQPALTALALGLLAGGGLFLLLALLGRGAMGAGDVKLAAALGALLGFPLVLRGLLWGVLAAGVVALLLLITRRAGRKDTMAYGPYLALGAWLVWTGSLGLWP